MNKKTNNDHKIPWMVFILLFPIPGVISYFMFGIRIVSKKLRIAINNEFESINKQLDLKHDLVSNKPKVDNLLYYIEKAKAASWEKARERRPYFT